MESVAKLVRKMEEADQNGYTQASKYVQVTMRDDINTTEAYYNSKHKSGEQDYMGRKKPFFNICKSAVNIWFRATDLDRKNIKIKADKESVEIEAFLASILLQEWMRRQNFGQFLNDLGMAAAKHGSVVVKTIEKKDELCVYIPSWNNLIVDPIDFAGNPKIEKIWYTPAQLLKNKNYNQAFVKKLIENPQSRETSERQEKDQKDEYICVYEVHGELAKSYLTHKEEDDDTFVQQMHVVSLQSSKDNPEEYEEFTLYSGQEKKDPYLKLDLLPDSEKTYTGGAVLNLKDAQWMVNHNVKLTKDQLDLASKIFFQTSDETFKGRNAYNLDNGYVFTHRINEPITAVNNRADIAAIQSSKNEWQSVALQINGISEAMAGQNAPSGTAWRQVEALLQESRGLFELMTENKALFIEKWLREFGLPYFKKHLDTSEEISSILEDWQIKFIDSRFLPNKVIKKLNQKKKETILSGQIFDPGLETLDEQQFAQELQGILTGNQRFIRPSDVDSATWKEAFKDLEWDVEVDITSEQRDIQSALETLKTVFQTLVSAPQALQDPNVKLVFNKILSIAGAVSPLELENQQSTQQLQAPQVPQMPQEMAPLTT